MPTLTSNFDFNKPRVNNATDADLWGGYLNTNFDDLDALLPVTTSAENANFSVAATEFNYMYLIDASGGAVTATLPAVANVFNGFVVHFKAVDVTNTITIDGDGAETINGSATVTLPYANQTMTLVASGSAWHILNKNTNTLGRLVQAVNSTTTSASATATQIPWDNTVPLNTEGEEFMTATITPTLSTNKLRIDVVFNFSQTGATSNSCMALFQDSTVNALAAVSANNPTGNSPNQMTLTHYMTAGTTSATTFKVRAGPASSETMTFNGAASAQKFGGVSASSITVTEILG